MSDFIMKLVCTVQHEHKTDVSSITSTNTAAEQHATSVTL